MTSDIATSTLRKDRSASGKVPLSARPLQRENRAFRGTSGISQENRQMGFRPAFYDAATHSIYPSRYADGRLAPCHFLDGLPEEVIVKRDPNGSVSTVKSTLVTGFTRNGLFYSREQATRLTADPAQAVKGDKKSPSPNTLDLSPSQSQPLFVKFIWFIGLYTGSLLSFKLLTGSVRWALMLATGYSY